MKFISKRLTYLFFGQNKLAYFLVILYCIVPLIFISLILFFPDLEEVMYAKGKISILGTIIIVIILAHFASVVTFIFIIIHQIIETLRNYEKRKNLDSVNSFIKSLETNKNEAFCFIIRPFGSDECLLIEESLDVLNPFKTNFLTVMTEERRSQDPFIFGSQKLLDSFIVSTSVEAIIADAVKTSFKMETICLADPSLNIFPKSVKYLVATESNWRDAVDILLKKTLITILIYQPETLVGHSTRWETEKINRLGLLNRFIIILPPTNSPDYMKAYESLTSLENELPYASFLPKQLVEKPIVICLDEGRICFFYAENEEKTNSEDYMRSIFQAFKVIKKHLKKVGHKNLYPHWNEKLSREFRQKHGLS